MKLAPSEAMISKAGFYRRHIRNIFCTDFAKQSTKRIKAAAPMKVIGNTV